MVSEKDYQPNLSGVIQAFLDTFSITAVTSQDFEQNLTGLIRVILEYGGGGGGGGTGTVTSASLTMPTQFSVAGSPITTAGTFAVSWASATGNTVFAAPNGSSGTPAFRALVPADLGSGTADSTTFLRGDGTWATPAGGGLGTVTSVDLAFPNIFSLSGNPITSSGTITATLASQTQNRVWAAPNGVDGTPAFRALVAADIPNLDAAKITSGTFDTARLGSGTANGSTFLRGDGTWAAPSGGGTVTSVDLALPNIFSLSGNPITSSGTITATLASQTQNTVWAAPNGSNGSPTFRALVAGDIPNLDASKITTGTMATARLGSGTASSTTFLRGDQSWSTAVTSITVEAQDNCFAVTNPTITSSGTVSINFLSRVANYVLCAPDGTNGTPFFRPLVENDIPSLNASKIAGGTLDAARLAADGYFCQGRLTLTSGTPITTSDVTAATTLYFTPYGGNVIHLWDGSIWRPYTFSELSVSLSGFTSNTNFDVFAYYTSGAVTLQTVAWTDSSTRASAVSLRNGRWVKTSDDRLLVGTFRTTGTTGQTEDSAAKRLIHNTYNRVGRHMTKADTTSSWTYSTASWRQARATTSNQVEVVCSEPQSVRANFAVRSSANAWHAIGVDSDSPHASSPPVFSSSDASKTAIVSASLAAGYHTVRMLELAGTGTVTIYGDSGVGGTGTCIMSGEVFA